MSVFIVTGATGFVGSNLCKKLVKENHEVHIINRKESSLKNLAPIIDKIKIYIYDDNIDNMIEYFKNANPRCVFHLASLVIPEHRPNDVFDLINSNINFSTQILEAMHMSGVKNIINTGTSWQHFENEEYNPVCLYAATKEAFGNILTYYVNAYKFQAITLKLFDTYGENDTRDKLINNLRNLAINKTELKMTYGYQKIDLTHVDDVVDAYMYALRLFDDEKFSNNKSYGVCTERLVSLRELIDIFETINNVKLNIKWGEKPYRFREVMLPWSNYSLLPGWKSKISLEEGVKKIGKKI